MLEEVKEMAVNQIHKLLNVRDDFPILRQEVRPGVPLIYLDSAATAQKPDVVIETVDRYYRETNSNVHRGIHTLSEKATTEYEAARDKMRNFIHAASSTEMVFTR